MVAEIDEGEMADALIYELNKSPWKAERTDEEFSNEFIFTNEHGDRYLVEVTLIEDEDNDDAS